MHRRSSSPVGGLSLCGALFALALAYPSTAPAQQAPEGLLLASGTDGVRIYDPARDVVVFDYITDGIMARQGGCHIGSCFPLAAQYVNHGGIDYVDVGIVRYGIANPDPRKWFPSVVTRVKVDAVPTEIWTIRELDFRDVPDGDFYCTQGDDEPYGSSRNAGCGLAFVHGFDVIEDVPEEKRVTVIISDPWNQRVLQASLDYTGGNTAAHVDWVLGNNHADWPIEAFPNHVMQALGDDGERYMLVTYVDAEATPYFAAPLTMWRWDDVMGAWDAMWRHPDPLSGELPYLQGVHMAEVLRDPDTGRQVIWYGHGQGMASQWATGSSGVLGGSFGFMTPGATLGDRPQYHFDARLFSDDDTEQVNYARDVDFLEDGSLLMIDGACQSGGCPEEAAVFHVARMHDGAPPSDKSGAFTPDHSTQTVEEVPRAMVLAEYRCNFSWLFEAEWITRGQMGRNLTSLSRRATQPCYDVEPETPTPAPSLR